MAAFDRIISIPSVINGESESGRNLDDIGWRLLWEQAPPGGRCAARQLRPNGFGHRLCFHPRQDKSEAPLYRLVVEPNERNGLRAVSRIMVDKIIAIPKSKVGVYIGRLDDRDLRRLNRGIFVFMGLAG